MAKRETVKVKAALVLTEASLASQSPGTATVARAPAQVTRALPRGYTGGLGPPRVPHAPFLEEAPPLLSQTPSGGLTSVILSSIFTQRWQEMVFKAGQFSHLISTPLQGQGPQLTFTGSRDREWFKKPPEGSSQGQGSRSRAHSLVCDFSRR